MGDASVGAEARKLKRRFKFNDDDLEHNRRGIISDKQMKRINGYERGGRIVGILMGALLLVFAGVFSPLELSLIQTLQQTSFFKEIPWLWFLIGGVAFIFGLLLLVLGIAGIFLIVSQFIKRKPYKLLSIRGRARLEKRHGAQFRHVYHDLYINDQEFDGDSTMHNVIIPGAEYRVYYLEGVEEIVSMELIPDMDNQ